MESLGHASWKVDPDLSLKPESRLENGVQYDSNLLCYVDDITCIYHNADTVLQHLHQSSSFKLVLVNPDMYLGAKFCKNRLHNGVWANAMSPMKYVQQTVRNSKAHLVENFSDRFRLPKKPENPFRIGYIHEMDISPELE